MTWVTLFKNDVSVYVCHVDEIYRYNGICFDIRFSMSMCFRQYLSLSCLTWVTFEQLARSAAAVTRDDPVNGVSHVSPRVAVML